MSTPAFHRMVLELGHGAADPGMLRAVAALARLLDVELHALFVEDETLLTATGLSFTREISVLSGQWRPLETERLEAELRAASTLARRYLAEISHATGIRQQFEVRRGDLALHAILGVRLALGVFRGIVGLPLRRLGGHGHQRAPRRSDSPGVAGRHPWRHSARRDASPSAFPGL